MRRLYFDSDCLAGEHQHRVWPDQYGGLHPRTSGAEPTDGDRLQDSAAVSQGLCPVAGLFYQPQPLAGTGPVCGAATDRYPGQVRSSCIWVQFQVMPAGNHPWKGFTHRLLRSQSERAPRWGGVCWESRLVHDSTLWSAVERHHSFTHSSSAVLNFKHNRYLCGFTVRTVLANLQQILLWYCVHSKVLMIFFYFFIFISRLWSWISNTILVNYHLTVFKTRWSTFHFPGRPVENFCFWCRKNLLKAPLCQRETPLLFRFLLVHPSIALLRGHDADIIDMALFYAFFFLPFNFPWKLFLQSAGVLSRWPLKSGWCTESVGIGTFFIIIPSNVHDQIYFWWVWILMLYFFFLEENTASKF